MSFKTALQSPVSSQTISVIGLMLDGRSALAIGNCENLIIDVDELFESESDETLKVICSLLLDHDISIHRACGIGYLDLYIA